MFDISSVERDGLMAIKDPLRVSLLKISRKLTIRWGTEGIECPVVWWWRGKEKEFKREKNDDESVFALSGETMRKVDASKYLPNGLCPAKRRPRQNFLHTWTHSHSVVSHPLSCAPNNIHSTRIVGPNPVSNCRYSIRNSIVWTLRQWWSVH